jgi:hypothetical protein
VRTPGFLAILPGSFDLLTLHLPRATRRLAPGQVPLSHCRREWLFSRRGVRWMGALRGQQGGGNGPEIPAAALLDVMFIYDTAQWRYALNINNATGKTCFSTCLARGDCWYGARRSMVVSATYRFWHSGQKRKSR